MPLRLIHNYSHNVFLNLAMDHSLFEYHYLNPTPLMIRIWKNEPSVIVGRSQDIHSEVEFSTCVKHNILVARRISGGGTVYHDLGNLNLSFFLFLPSLSSWGVKDISAARSFISTHVARVLQDLGYNVSVGDRNSIFLKDRKISGSGAYFRKNVLLHQMTLLFNANLDLLEKVLKARFNYATKRFPSVYSPTTNLVGLSEDWFISRLVTHFQEVFDSPFEKTSISEKEQNLASYLEKILYRNEKWIMHGDRSALPLRLPL